MPLYKVLEFLKLGISSFPHTSFVHNVFSFYFYTKAAIVMQQ